MMNPYLSWAILLVVAGGLGWYYNGPTPKTPVKPVVEKPEAATGAKKPKRKTVKKEKSPEPSPAPAKTEEKKQPAAEVKSQEADKADEEIDNKEMAKRFTAVKNGTVPAPTLGSSKSQKKKKKNNKKAAPTEQSTRSPSTTGADADDDLSSAGSPVVNPTSAGYVSDMLEETVPAASVLRVTGNFEQQPKKQKTQSFKQVETKKQRQQRLKNEARKEQVKEAEDERRKLLEKQLHTAREAERREAAKAKPATPTTNAWQTKSANSVANGAPKAAAVPKVELLDTFDNEASSAKSNQWSRDLPSEEEQMRMLSGADEWTTVSTKAKKPKKKGGKADESVSEASASESNQPALAPVPAEPKVTVTPTYIPDILRSKQKGHPLDSDWAA